MQVTIGRIAEPDRSVRLPRRADHSTAPLTSTSCLWSGRSERFAVRRPRLDINRRSRCGGRNLRGDPGLNDLLDLAIKVLLCFTRVHGDD